MEHLCGAKIFLFDKALFAGHVRNYSSGGLDNLWSLSSIVDIELLQAVRAHSQPILCLEIRGGKVLTGSQVC
jgi:hypothetical protein